MKLRTKLSVIFVILQILIITGMGISLYLTVRESIRNQINNDLDDKVILLTRIIETYFNISDEYKNDDIISYIESDRLYLKKQLDITIGDTGYTYIINSEGYMIIHPNLEGEYIADREGARGEKFFQDIIDMKNGHIDYYWEDQHGNAREKFVYFRFIEELDWIVVAGTYYDEFYQPLNLILVNLLITLVIALIVFIVITYIVLTRSLKPVDNIVRVSEDLANGIIKTDRIEVKTKDEIGKMTKSFNRLVDFLEERNKLMESIGKGDFTITVKLSSEKDEVGKTLKNMVESLNKTLRNIYTVIDQLSGGAEQISESSQALAGGANEQAASIEEITVSLEEIEYKAKSNFSSLEEARELTKQSRVKAAKGNKQMRNLVASIEDINKSSQEIKDITKIISDISFQTNLLALNADIEAARVGKYGRGFAVVANSVRELAQKSNNALTDISQMVENATSNIDTVNELINYTSSQLKEIVKDTNKVTNFVDNIVTSTEEQVHSIEQINKGITQIEQVIQSNSANAEENASSSEELHAQAHHLKELISVFNFK